MQDFARNADKFASEWSNLPGATIDSGGDMWLGNHWANDADKREFLDWVGVQS